MITSMGMLQAERREQDDGNEITSRPGILGGVRNGDWSGCRGHHPDVFGERVRTGRSGLYRGGFRRARRRHLDSVFVFGVGQHAPWRRDDRRLHCSRPRPSACDLRRAGRLHCFGSDGGASGVAGVGAGHEPVCAVAAAGSLRHTPDYLVLCYQPSWRKELRLGAGRRNGHHDGLACRLRDHWLVGDRWGGLRSRLHPRSIRPGGSVYSS